MYGDGTIRNAVETRLVAFHHLLVREVLHYQAHVPRGVKDKVTAAAHQVQGHAEASLLEQQLHLGLRVAQVVLWNLVVLGLLRSCVQHSSARRGDGEDCLHRVVRLLEVLEELGRADELELQVRADHLREGVNGAVHNVVADVRLHLTVEHGLVLDVILLRALGEHVQVVDAPLQAARAPHVRLDVVEELVYPEALQGSTRFASMPRSPQLHAVVPAVASEGQPIQARIEAE
mmetsp:Transcript_34909/g.107211  ORF Transcript_34909/g.107211 Transcript_34909/m.107211 type:complete len:232 (+) Transcript_34909:211-906(+)